MVVLEECSSSFSPSSSTSFQLCTYDVFLSFRGSDNRNSFTAHLYDALCRKGIRTYMDDELKIGENISEALLKAIESSSIAIIVLSKNYADSRWCLDELIKILECKEKKQQMIVPIFYDVEPSEVRNQTGSVGKAFAKLKAKFMDDVKLQRWKRALKDVADLSGCHLQNRKEPEFIQEIIQKLEPQKLKPRIVYQLDIAKYPVGIESRIQQVNLLLNMEMNDRRMVGIVGTGGIGKTTIVKAIYNLIAYQFDGSCFLSNVRETCEEKNGLLDLQSELLSKVLENSSPLVDIIDRGITMIKQSLNSKKVLIVLDDVGQLVQLEKLVGECKWFGLGSRIVITTRDKGLLTKHGVDLIYQVDGLNGDEALELFSWNAFKKKTPHDDFVELSQQVVGYAGGIPLALQVMGSNLLSKSLREWKNIFEKYKVILHGDIEKILQVSYVGLDCLEKNIFLDIACFFKGRDLHHVSGILNKCGFFADCGIQELVNKSFITISMHNTLEMHDLIQQMGKEEIRRESPNDPGRRSRLWDPTDVRHVLEENTGTNKIEGILVAFPKEEEIHLNPKVFKKMKKLRLFLNKNTKFSKTPNFLSNELRVLHWSGFPRESWPSNFRGRNLIELILYRSNLKTYQIIENFENLTSISFQECEFLREILDLSMLLNLKTFDVTNCENLEKVHSSRASFDKLISLKFENCPNLKSLWRSLKLRSLQEFTISKCPRLKHSPEIECPKNYRNWIKIVFQGCESLREIPDLSMIPDLQRLEVSNCKNLEKIYPSIASFDKLLHLTFVNCPNLKSFWMSVTLRSLSSLVIFKCPSLMQFPEMECPMECLEGVQLAFNCIEELPLSWKLTSGETLDLMGSKNVENLLNIIYWSQSKTSIESTSFCNVGRSFPMAPECFSGFVELNLSETNIISLPTSIQDCCKLRELYLDDCQELKEISRLPPYLTFLHASNCMSLEKFRLDARNSPWIGIMHLSGCQVLEDLANDVESFVLREEHASAEEDEKLLALHFSFPGYEIPDWFSYKKVVNGNSSEMDIIDLPNLDWKIKGIAFCFIFRKQNTQTAELSQWGFDVICGGSKIYSNEFEEWDLQWGNICVLYKNFEPFKMKGDGMHVHLRHLTEVPLFESWGVHLVRDCFIEDWMTNRHDRGRKRPLDDDDGSNFYTNRYVRRRKNLSISCVGNSNAEDAKC